MIESPAGDRKEYTLIPASDIVLQIGFTRNENHKQAGRQDSTVAGYIVSGQVAQTHVIKHSILKGNLDCHTGRNHDGDWRHLGLVDDQRPRT